MAFKFVEGVIAQHHFRFQLLVFRERGLIFIEVLLCLVDALLDLRELHVNVFQLLLSFDELLLEEETAGVLLHRMVELQLGERLIERVVLAAEHFFLLFYVDQRELGLADCHFGLAELRFEDALDFA